MYSALSARLDHFWRIPVVYFVTLTALASATPLAFAPYYCFWLMPLVFGGFIRLLELKPERAVRSAYWFGLVGYTAQFWWIHEALHGVAGLPNLYALPLTVLLPAALAVFPALAVRLWRGNGLARAWSVGLLLPIVWTLAEFARERMFTGFGWGALGYTQIADMSPLAGFAPLGGIHLVTLATALAGAWLVLLVNNKRRREQAVALAGLAVLFGGGFLLRAQSFTEPAGEKVSVALAQGNIEQRLKFDPEKLPETFQRYFELVRSTKAQIVVLPETAFPLFWQDMDPFIPEAFAEAARQNGSRLAVGVPVYTEDGLGYLNAMMDITDYRADTPAPLPLYAKNHLVPFGEYKPFPVLTERLYGLMNLPLAEFKRGGEGQKPFAMAGQQVAFNICYEDGFGDELIASAKQSTLLANSSNMAWYGQSNAMWQQLQQSQARALELGRYMLRATNTGATAIVSPQGQVVKLAAPDTVALLEGEVQGMTGETPYMQTGGSWPLIVVLAVSAALLRLRGRRKRAG